MQSRTIAVVLGLQALFVSAAGAADQVLILGDSLSKEYSVEFAGDGYPGSVKNWIEILDDVRSAELDYGPYGSWPDYRAAGHQFNWSIPGAKIGDFVDIVNGKTILDQIARGTIRSQLQTQAERFVLFVGGNDTDSVYGPPYNGTGNWDAFIATFAAGVAHVLDWVIAQNPSLEIVLVNVPHVGITPKVKGEYPPDPVKTGRVTTEYIKLNNALLAVANARGIGYADVFSGTLDLLGPEPLCIQGVPFINAGSAGGSLDYVWLAGSLSDNFHPNTNGCALVANAIVEAFNARYGAGIRLLTTEEILEDFLGKNADISFAEWLACYGYAGGLPTDDPEVDGVCHLVEFGLGMDPRKRDRLRLPAWKIVEDGGAWVSTLTYRPRLAEASTVVAVAAVSSENLTGWNDAGPGQTTLNGDGSLTVGFPVTGAEGYQRIEVRLLAP